MITPQLKPIQFEELYNGIENNVLTYDNIYNLDLNYKQIFAIQHYLKGSDTLEKNQILNTVFGDIEVFRCHAEDPDIMNPNYPINAITIFSTETNEFYSYYLLLKENKHLFNIKTINEITKEFEKELFQEKYIKSNEKINIYIYEDEIKLITDCWRKIHDLDPAILSGFYFDTFDLPFMYERVKVLFQQDMNRVNLVFSKFGVVDTLFNTNRTILDIVDYTVLDLCHLYKPRDDHGLTKIQLM